MKKKKSNLTVEVFATSRCFVCPPAGWNHWIFCGRKGGLYVGDCQTEVIANLSLLAADRTRSEEDNAAKTTFFYLSSLHSPPTRQLTSIVFHHRHIHTYMLGTEKTTTTKNNYHSFTIQYNRDTSTTQPRTTLNCTLYGRLGTPCTERDRPRRRVWYA